MQAPNPIIKKECYISLACPTTWIIYGSEREINHSTIFAIPGLSILFTSYIDPSGHSIGFNLTQIQHGQEGASCLWWTKLFRHQEEVLRHRTRGVISNSSNSKVQTILEGQQLHRSCGPPTLKMAFVSAWPNLNTSPGAIDIAGIWL